MKNEKKRIGKKRRRGSPDNTANNEKEDNNNENENNENENNINEEEEINNDPQITKDKEEELNENKSNKSNSENSENSENWDSATPHPHHPRNKNLKFKQNLRNTSFGLKEISKRVMEIIKQSGQTTYKAISDQIVNEINEKSLKDEKNIRRRIYDSLNVMKSMKLFNRDSKTKSIMWNYEKELDPLNENEDKNLKLSGEINKLKKEIKEKNEKKEIFKRELFGLKNVLERNKRENEKFEENDKFYFPFIVIEFQSNKENNINIALNENQTNAHIGFDEANAMFGDLDMVSKIGNQNNISK